MMDTETGFPLGRLAAAAAATMLLASPAFAGKGLADYEIAYHANIAWLDDTIGDLVGYLDAKDFTKNTPENGVLHRVVRLGDYKLISPENTDNHAAITKGWPKPAVKAPDLFTDLRLFNVVTDPQEKTNLANDPAHAAKRNELLALLNQWWPLNP